MKRVAIVGGGIAGLSAAYYLEKARRSGQAIEWMLFEKAERLGGVIRTEYTDDLKLVLEAGPDSFLTAKPEAAEMCRELGLAGEIVYSNDAQRKTYIVVRGRLTPIPDGLQFMVPTRILPMAATRLFSFGAKVGMLREFFSRAGVHRDRDESVADFVRRHFGQEMVDRVAEPLLAGVYGGNADKLSLRAVLPRFSEMERLEGSLVRAALKARKSAGQGTPQPPLFTSLRRGMQQLVDALIAALPASSMRLRQSATSLRRINQEWRLETSAGNAAFDAVLLALPAPLAAPLLRDAAPQAAAGLQQIEYTSSAAVLLAYDKLSLPPGTGFLVPASERRKMLACTFVHNKFSGRAAEGIGLLRCFFSGGRMADLLDHSDDQLISFARREIKELLGLDLEPKFTHAFRWRYGLPQYETGHLDRAAEIESRIHALPGLHIAGNSLYGVGMPDCIRSARQAVEQIQKLPVETLQTTP